MSSILTVTQLNRYVSFRIKDDSHLRGLLIRGEISGFNHHQRSGHFYFTLKDRESSLKAVMFASFASRLAFMPKSGMDVIVSGSVQVYERDGVYQLYVTDIQPAGIGAAYLAVEQIKERLAAKGVFDVSLKKPLPRFPEKVGIVTAKGGAALQDILNIIGRRYPLCEAVVFPCVVQGEYAVGSVCEALRFADSCGCDVIICGRGGGSAEDLMPFNSEEIAMTVFNMNTPVISAVGHETDTTVIDLAADMRAPTPSAAAELAVPDIRGAAEAVRIRQKALGDALARLIAAKRHSLLEREAALKGYIPSAAVAAMRERTAAAERRLCENMSNYLAGKAAELSFYAERLDSLSPLKIMARGYSLVYSDGRLIRSASDVKSGDIINVKFADGEITAEIKERRYNDEL